MSKTKELLANLNKLTDNPVKKFTEPTSIPDTNRMWKSVIDTYNFPASYKTAKWNKVVEPDNEIDYWTPYDRIYGGLSGESLVQKDGTEYKGKLHGKRRLVKSSNDTSFYSKCTMTADGRWFDNCGMPIEPPTKVEDEEEKVTGQMLKMEPTAEEVLEIKKRRLENEKNLLKNLK
jgi:hypothetical protein|tara:strand:+ start:121 stop:645 length:525 start_codon:yes stop_codon:yes gene_type:complete